MTTSDRTKHDLNAPTHHNAQKTARTQNMVSKETLLQLLADGSADFAKLLREGRVPSHLNFEKLADALISSPDLKAAQARLSYGNSRHLCCGRLLIPLFHEYGRRTRNAFDSLDLLEELLDGYLELAKAPENILRYRALVFGGTLRGTVQVGDTTYRRATAEEISEFRYELSQKGCTIPPVFHLLETSYSFPWNTQQIPDAEARARVESAKLVVGVANDDPLSEPYALATTGVMAYHRSLRVASGEFPVMPRLTFGPRSDAEVQQDVDALLIGLNGPNRSRMMFAMQRYCSSLRRTSPADRLVDAWIILESIYSDSSTELAHKVSFRVACTHAKSGIEAKGLFRFLKLSYSTRSKMVHGASGASSEWREADQVNSIARAAIFKLADSQLPFDPSAIDAAILERAPF